ncbi:MAG: hypothetical protein M1829_005431 [Trizodia sp. TS-e1964]|nr:MAG: hypothetical protein M1829_005431 [Trizodia sp. TS-e1964]
MKDPFFPPPQFLSRATQPIADYLGLITLPFHVHEVLLGWACYQLIFSVLSPPLSSWLFSKGYGSLPARSKIGWDVHVTSFIQSTFITLFSLYIIWTDEERGAMDWAGRIWGYTGAGGAVQGMVGGYFLWDVWVSIQHYNILGFGSLAHGISALLVTALGFFPFANYYGLYFILYEISTPFLNIHWFFDKLKMTGSRVQLYNGIILLLAFFGGRVVWGNYQSFRIYSDLWTALHSSGYDPRLAKDSALYDYRNGGGILTLSPWLAVVYVASNTLLNLLNLYWFSKMVQALRKRFPATEASAAKSIVTSKGSREHVD